MSFDPLFNQTTIAFDDRFKAMIRQLKLLPDVQELQNDNLIALGLIQERIRNKIPKKFIKNPKPDYYACMIQLLIDTEACNSWDDVAVKIEQLDFTDRSKENIEDDTGNFSTCMCSKAHISNKNIYLQSNGILNLMEGCICIEKRFITNESKIKFSEVKKRQKKIINDCYRLARLNLQTLARRFMLYSARPLFKIQMQKQIQKKYEEAEKRKEQERIWNEQRKIKEKEANLIKKYKEYTSKIKFLKVMFDLRPDVWCPICGNSSRPTNPYHFCKTCFVIFQNSN